MIANFIHSTLCTVVLFTSWFAEGPEPLCTFCNKSVVAVVSRASNIRLPTGQTSPHVSMGVCLYKESAAGEHF